MRSSQEESQNGKQNFLHLWLALHRDGENNMKIYLAGSVPKGDKEQKDFKNWRLEYKEKLQSFLDADFIDPYKREVDEADFLGVFGKDCLEIKQADLIIVNAEEKLGVGTSQELLVAKYFKKLVITVLPKESYHRKSNLVFHGKNVADWIHPFIFSSSDIIIEKVEEIENYKNEFNKINIKGITIIDEAIKYVENN
jgi:hypothetical protein